MKTNEDSQGKLVEKKYQVFINNKLIISGKFISRWAAFLAAADAYGMNRNVGSLVVRVIR